MIRARHRICSWQRPPPARENLSYLIVKVVKAGVETVEFGFGVVGDNGRPGSSLTRFTSQDRMRYRLGSPGLPTISRPPRWSVAVGTTWNGPSVVKRANLEVAYQVRQLLYSPSVGDL